MDNNSKQLKRSLEDSDSDTDMTTWPRFLIMEGTDLQHPLHKLSPFAIHKGILGISGEPVSVKKLRSGQILIEFDKQHYSTNLLKCKSFVQIPVQVTPHKTLNTKKGIIRCADLRDCDDDEILDELKDQGVIRIQRMTINRNGMRRPTNTFIVTFDGSKLPRYITVGYLKVKVDMFIPNPIRCFNCQKFGHFRSNCKHEEVCANCGKAKHDSDRECPNAANCVNCGGKHSAHSKDCPRWQQEKEIQRIKCELNLSYLEAKKRLNPTQSTSSSYAKVVSSVKTRTIQTQTEYTWLEKCQHPKKIETNQNGKGSHNANNQNANVKTATAATNTNKPEVKLVQYKQNQNKAGTSKTNQKVILNRDFSGKKGSNDPILQANRYSALSSDDEENMVIDPPSHTEQTNKNK